MNTWTLILYTCTVECTLRVQTIALWGLLVPFLCIHLVCGKSWCSSSFFISRAIFMEKSGFESSLFFRFFFFLFCSVVVVLLFAFISKYVCGVSCVPALCAACESQMNKCLDSTVSSNCVHTFLYSAPRWSWFNNMNKCQEDHGMGIFYFLGAHRYSLRNGGMCGGERKNSVLRSRPPVSQWRRRRRGHPRTWLLLLHFAFC